MFTQLCLQASEAANQRMQGPDFDFRDINIPRSNVTQEGVICNLCNTLTKRFTYHVKKCHKDSLTNASKVFESQFKNFLHTVRQQRHKGQQDSKDFRDYERQMKRNSRKRLKAENLKKAKAIRKRENMRRKGRFDGNEVLPCASCFTLEPVHEFLPVGYTYDEDKRCINRKATLAFEAAQSLSLEMQPGAITGLAAMEKGTMVVVDNKEEVILQSEVEYGGAWEDESDMEEDVDWKLVRPKWIVGMAAEWAQEFGRIKRVIRWNLDHGTKDKHDRLRWKLRKLDKYADWLWLDLQKLCKEQENISEETCAEEEEETKGWALNVYKSLYTLEYEIILRRFCFWCKGAKKPKID